MSYLLFFLARFLYGGILRIIYAISYFCQWDFLRRCQRHNLNYDPCVIYFSLNLFVGFPFSRFLV
jgi:hypothetical protein